MDLLTNLAHGFSILADPMVIVYSLIGVEGIRLTLIVSPAALGIAAAVAFLTVVISAWVPARRASFFLSAIL